MYNFKGVVKLKHVRRASAEDGERLVEKTYAFHVGVSREHLSRRAISHAGVDAITPPSSCLVPSQPLITRPTTLHICSSYVATFLQTPYRHRHRRRRWSRQGVRAPSLLDVFGTHTHGKMVMSYTGTPCFSHRGVRTSS